jgi:hypothetical protein
MATFSKKMGGKEVGDASVYAKPHTMSGKVTSGKSPKKEFATSKSAKDAGVSDPLPNGVSFGRSGEPKTTGMKMRGAGAATKGVMSRGPMA